LDVEVDWRLELVLAGRCLLAALLGAFVGWERERTGRAAGIRTYAAVCMGSCVFGLVSLVAARGFDPTRIAAQVASGIGFLGAGVILREMGKIRGLTTAASLWSAAAVGLAVAFGLYLLAVLTSVILFVLLWLSELSSWSSVSPKHRHGVVDVEEEEE
jgi:putative Mg2+ transporter-C (MgtC) family protein